MRLAVVCGVLAVVLFMAAVIGFGSSQVERSYTEAFEAGRNAKLHGVPAEANPYLRGGKEARLWLDGWIAQTKEQGK
jgi:hypothetical protein